MATRPLETLTAAQKQAIVASIGLYLGRPGQCQLTRTDATHLKLVPFRGNLLFINGTTYVVPTAGVSVDTTGLAVSTLYYVYAYISAGAIALELSATARATSSTYGNEVKTGDETRALVGMARTDGSTQFVDTVTQRFVRSWFNDRGITGLKTLTATVTEATGTFTELATGDRNEFLAWAGETFQFWATSQAQGSVADCTASLRVGIDGSAQSPLAAGQVYGTAKQIALATAVAATIAADGYHYQSMLGRGQAGTASFLLGTSTSHGYRGGGG